MLKKLIISASALALSACAFPTTTLAQEAPSGPALWVAQDEDTTIYLFGTVHVLPEGLDWLQPTVAEALASSDQFVSEIDTSQIPEFDPASGNPPPPEILAIGQMQVEMGTLTTGGTLRDLMTDEHRTAYEETLGQLGIPPAAFDGFAPWFAAITLSQLMMMQAGLDPANGVERQLDHLIEGKDRAAFETIEQQFTFFDTIPIQSQVSFLTDSSGGLEDMETMFGSMVDEWISGDPEGLADVINQGLGEPHVRYNLLTLRNYNWAGWIDDRMDQPGTVFIAVGAGHLAGEYTVQDFLAERGIITERVEY